MAEPLKARIVRVRAAPLLSPIGGVEQRMAVDWTVDGSNLFTLYIPTAEFTAEKAGQAIEKAAAEVIKLLSQ
jgi:hypothetical protein